MSGAAANISDTRIGVIVVDGIGLGAAVHRISEAVRATISSGVATADVGGLSSTSEFAETVLARTLRRARPSSQFDRP
ncbi:hypothetical protein [Rhodococcus marinonascens]|uniref:hypothetical protein n=1 Tax=Rhodococcus marinonascens TaxID=38311 RepID=UPI000B0DB1C4|nr:hypothetical protein [Rhodococcus marinonascens]